MSVGDTLHDGKLLLMNEETKVMKRRERVERVGNKSKDFHFIK